MFVRVTCQSCGAAFKVHAKFAGKVGTCPNEYCGKKFLVPKPSGDAAASEAKAAAGGSAGAVATKSRVKPTISPRMAVVRGDVGAKSKRETAATASPAPSRQRRRVYIAAGFDEAIARGPIGREPAVPS